MSNAASEFTRELLSYGRNIHNIADAADAAPDDPVLNAYAAAAALFAMTGDAAAKAAPYLARAQAAAADRDDVDLVRAVAAWAAGDVERAAALHAVRLERRPDDLAAAKICQLHLLDRGDVDGLLRTVRLVLRANPSNHYVLGQLAFALEQAGDFDGAETAARRALDLAADDDPWTHHAMAHLLYGRGDVAAGVAWIERHADLWSRSNAFMLTHAWWHAAISHLDADDTDRALAVYDERLTTACPNCVQSLVNAVSLLARLTLRGVDVGSRWDPLGDRLAARIDDRVNGFLDLHYLYGLALGGRHAEAATMLAALASSRAADGARGLAAHAAGAVNEAAALLSRAAPRLRELGGSHEQRDLYELVELDSCLRAGRLGQARALLARRITARPSIAWQQRVLDGLDHDAGRASAITG